MRRQPTMNSQQSTANNQCGSGLLLLIGFISLAIIGAIVVTTPQVKQFIMPQTAVESSPTPTSTPAAPQLSEKQQLYLRNKERIKQELNLTDAQFDLLVESAAKN